MSTDPRQSISGLNTYLNDHLAGATAALDLLDHIIDTAGSSPDAAFFRDLRAEIAGDRATLESVLEHAGGSKSGVRQAGGWLAEKIGRLKLVVDDPSRGALHRLESLEILVVGIHGKRLLWRALGGAALPGLTQFDFVTLERRATDQHDRVDARRLEAARHALSASA